jgi:hypothetical protein
VKNVIVCSPKSLPISQLLSSATTAVKVNPHNQPNLERLSSIMPGFRATPARIAVMTKKYWGIGGVKLTVGFLDNPPSDLRKRILSHMNAWSATANVKFTETKDAPQVRIAREGGRDGGYWSYLGTDILHIQKNKATMNLEGFTMDTPDSEFYRVVRHETGHTLGCPHEHMRKALVDKIDRQKAIDYFMATQDWSEEEVIDQVLTPLEESALISSLADAKSIMCYQIPGELTINGKPIIGGKDIVASDFKFMGAIYPNKTSPAKKKPSSKKASSKKASSKKAPAKKK